MHTKQILYQYKDLECKGYLAFDTNTPRPAVLVAHAWRGQDQFARAKATALASLGYVGFAVDYYGMGQTADSNEEAEKLMMPLFLDRRELQLRLKAAFDCVRAHPMVDPDKIAVMGFCFGGLGAIELYRSGAPLRSAVSFHAILANEMHGQKAQTVPIAKGIKGSLLMLHGHDDPLVSDADIHSIQTELTDADLDWQMHIYGKTSHAFTVPEANDPSMGLRYNAKSDARSWQSLQNFLRETL